MACCRAVPESIPALRLASASMVTTRAYLERTPVALAHRGGSLYAPNLGLENTMTAFGNAVDLGYTHLETDVHVTRDGRLVAFHDTVLDRVSNAHGRIRDLPWSEVSHAEVGDGGHVPLLSEVLDAWPDVNLNIDLKAPGTAEPLWRLIEERGLHDQVCVGSFSQRNISQFRRLSQGTVATAAAQVGTALARSGRVRSPRCSAPRPTSSRSRHRSPCAAGPFRWSPSASSRPPTATASRSTSGPSTTPTRCGGCSTSASTASSATASTCSRTCSSNVACGPAATEPTRPGALSTGTRARGGRHTPSGQRTRTWPRDVLRRVHRPWAAIDAPSPAAVKPSTCAPNASPAAMGGTVSLIAPHVRRRSEATA